MNLTALYEQRVAYHPLPGVMWTNKQARMYNSLRDVVLSGGRYVFTPYELGAPRRSGKTLVLLGLAKEFDMILLVHSRAFAGMLKKQYPGIEILSSTDLTSLRGRRQPFLVDEVVDVDYLRRDLGLPIITGINGRNLLDGY